MWSALSPVEIQELKTEKFSQAEVCYITGLSPERILTWHKLNLIPEPRKETGKGHRRKYNFHQLAWLTGMRILSKRGVPLEGAKALTEILLVERIEEALGEMCACATVEAANQQRVSAIAIYDLQEQEGAEQYRFEMFWEGRPMSYYGQGGWKEDAPESLDAWMRKECVNDVIFIDVGGAALNLYLTMDEVLEGRKRDNWREELREFMLGFKRAKEPKKPWQEQLRQTMADAWMGKPYKPQRPFRTAKDTRKKK